jgi:HAD superfamily hydrolase (TIGR01490 family)
MRKYLSSLCTGWDVNQVKDIVAETLHGLIDPLIYDEAATLIEEHHLADREVVIVSSSGAEVVEPIGEMLGADRVIATRLEVVDGRYTGEVAFFAAGAGKRAAAEAGLTRAVSGREADDLLRDAQTFLALVETITDLPMLEVVGHPYAVNPDRALRKECAQRGWPVLVFSKPVSMRQRMPTLTVPRAGVLAATAIGAVAAVAGLVWYVARHRMDEKPLTRRLRR